MKIYFITILYILIFSWSFISCDGYLDPKFMGELTVEEATSEYNYVRGQVASIYGDIKPGFLIVDGAMLASASDEAEHTLETSAIQHFNRGTWNEFQNPDNVWTDYYNSIRKINKFLVSNDNVNLDHLKNDPDQQAVYETYMANINRWKYEVRFLRAYFYFELVKRYGGVPIITDLYSLNDSFDNIPRSSLADCIDFITDECDSVAKVLPPRYDAGELGRVTQVAALALKSRVLLYAASELFNNASWASGYANTSLIALSGDRQARWRAAANAAKAAIDLAESNAYVLSSNYKDVFGPNTHTNNEVIFFRRESASNSFERANISVGFDLGNSGTTPSQNLVDAYEMKDGSKFDWNNPQHAANPYANRDPRLSLTIVTNNSTFKGRPMECWEGGQDGPPIAQASKTGYYLRKYVNEDLNLVTNQTSTHSWVIFRLAELYLNYAEALNEADPGNSDIKTYVDKVRQRSGVNMPGLPSDLSQSQMRERIYNERQVEFAFEDHRLWDVRRWMLGTTVLSVPIKGVKVTMPFIHQFNYSVIEVEPRTFLPKMNFYPIPQNEIYIDKALVQNPLW
jgi:hypothetical protein